MTGQAVNVQRNGKNYIIIKNLSVRNQVSNFKGYVEYVNAIEAAIYSLVNGVINASWRMFKPILDPTINRAIGEVLIEIIEPIFNEISMQDFFNMNCTSKQCIV